MRIRQHDYIDWNSPGTMFPIRGERPREAPLGDIDLGDDLSPELVALTKRTAYRPTDPELLPAERFRDAPAPAWQCQMVDAPTRPEATRERSRSVALRFARSCSGWQHRPTAEEFYERYGPKPRPHASARYSTRGRPKPSGRSFSPPGPSTPTPSASLRRRCTGPACRGAGRAAALNRWAIYPGQPGIDE